MKATILPEHAESLHEQQMVGATCGPWAYVAVEHIRTRRWSEQYYLVVRNAEGEHWGLVFDEGLTEEQEFTPPWEGATDPLPLTRLYPHEVVKVEYRTTPPEPAATGSGSDG